MLQIQSRCVASLHRFVSPFFTLPPPSSRSYRLIICALSLNFRPLNPKASPMKTTFATRYIIMHPTSGQHYWERKPFKAKSFHESPPVPPSLFPEQNDQHLSVQQADMVFLGLAFFVHRFLSASSVYCVAGVHVSVPVCR